jgi:hypothetical protein
MIPRVLSSSLVRSPDSSHDQAVSVGIGQKLEPRQPNTNKLLFEREVTTLLQEMISMARS